MPSEETIKVMFTRNSDGAGYMYTHEGQVYIRKGFMTLSALMDSLNDIGSRIDLKEIPVVLHFRIGTAGGNIPANTHPFPLSHEMTALQKLKLHCNIGVVHNGIIDIRTSRTDISDTMEYIANHMSLLQKLCPDFYKTDIGRTLVENAITSKMAILNNKGQIYTIGSFETDETTGLMYSNGTYKPSTYLANYGAYGIYDDLYDEEDFIKRWETWKDKKENDTKKTPIRKWLMPLDDICYINTGLEYLECDSSIYYMDYAGFVYEYDFENDICVLISGGTAYNPSGAPVRYDGTNTELLMVEGRV